MSKQLESLLRQTGLATEPQIRRVLDRVAKDAGSFIDILVREEHVSEEELANLFTERMKVPRARVATFLPDEDALRKVPERLARKHLCLPLAIEARVLVLAMVNPIDYRAIQDVEFASALSIRPLVATHAEVLDGIDERYGADDRIATFLAKVEEPDIQILSEDSRDIGLDVADSLIAAEVAPVVKMCNLIIFDAVKTNASDVHIEPALHDLQVRMRVDGVLREYTRIPKWLHGPVVSRLKILAKLDIAERRLPQDGRVNVLYQGRSIDLRVSTLPTQFGEKMVLRVLGGMSAPSIDSLGLSAQQQAVLESAIQQPQGTILVTGPTGSGKTTTLYALLAKHHKPEVNIVTVEDPIEYQLAGINQVQINTKAGLTFASALRSILRQDPDVILVGEMRDKETSEIAFQAAMTGHMVLSTLHTNSAIATVARMLDLGVDATILSTSLTLVIAQRLVRRICKECREEYEPGPDVRMRVGMMVGDNAPVYHGRGCTACGSTGFSGRVGIYEMFRPTNAIRRLINDRASETDLRYAARQAGMALLREDALRKIEAGLTSPDEVLRVVQVDETEVPCPNCNALIEADFSTCPYCRLSLKNTCATCGQAQRLEWQVCPYCNANAGAPPPAEGKGSESGKRREGEESARKEEKPFTSMIDRVALAAAPRAATVAVGSASTAGEAVAVESDPTASPAAPTPAPAPIEPVIHPETGQRRLRVLVVDDDEDIRIIVSATLRNLSVPVEVVQAEDGVDAIEKATAATPDLVVLDVMMPRMDGLETCRHLRENVRTAFVPILMLTASVDQASRTKAYLIGTDDYMAKPFLPLDLKLRVARLLRRSYGI